MKPAPSPGEGAPPGRITLNHIAQEAGVSRMTVSLALRNSPQIAAKTRHSIRAIAIRLGYQPDPKVSQLMSQIRKTRIGDKGTHIAYLVAGEQSSGWHGNYTLQCYWEGAKARCKEAGYSLVEYWLNDPSFSASRLAEILYARGVPGVLLAPAYRLLTNQLPEHGIDFSRFSVVEISDAFAPPRLCKALHDYHSSIEALMDYLAGCGYRRMGLALLKHHDLAVHGRWYAGYLVKARAMGLPKIEPLILSEVEGARIRHWVERGSVEVVISATSLFASALESCGLKIPSDVAFADLDLNPFDDSGAIGGVDQNSHRIGMAAVEMLISQIHLGQKGVPETPVNVLVEGKVVPGRSMPDLNQPRRSKASPTRSPLRKVPKRLPGK